MVGQVALGVNENSRDALQSGFFKQDNAQTCFARAGHTHNNAMGYQVFRVIKS